MSNLNWSFYDVWNESLSQRDPKPVLPRNKIWASELGGSYVDRYLKMIGKEPSNPPNLRSLRKFEAGNLMEWVVELVLRRAGILIDSQEWVSFQYPGLLEVTGRLDHLAGGKPDWGEAENKLKELNLPEFFSKATTRIVDHLKEHFPDGLQETVLEVKSCSSYMYDVYEANGPAENHVLQAFHYVKAKDMPEAHVVYISKDDLRLLEFGVYNNEKFEKLYKEDIETLSQYYFKGEQPPLEPLISFNRGRFSPNWKVQYSNYLKDLYGYDDYEAFEDAHKGTTAKWNRVVGRILREDRMTPNNLEVIQEIKQQFPDFEELMEQLKNDTKKDS